MKIIACDCVGTVFDTANIPHDAMRDYIRQTKRTPWQPLTLTSCWWLMPAHPDAAEGIARLRAKYRVVTCSNFPLDLLRKLSDASGIRWDAIVPLEASMAYKPARDAYEAVCDVLQAAPHEILVVTAHPDGPDAKGAPAAGMGLQIIRQPGCPQTFIELAEQLGC